MQRVEYLCYTNPCNAVVYAARKISYPKMSALLFSPQKGFLFKDERGGAIIRCFEVHFFSKFSITEETAAAIGTRFSLRKSHW